MGKEAPQVYDSLAYAHLRNGGSEKAKQTFTKALALQSDFAGDYSSDDFGTHGL